MTRERIEDMREVVLPFVKKRLLETNYEGLGESDAKEFEREFNEILNLAIKALEQEPTTKNDKVDCEHTDCNNCVNHKYCDYEKFDAVMDNMLKHPSTTKNDLEVEKIIDELEKEFEKVNIPIMDKLTLFAKTQNALYRCADMREVEEK